MSKHRKRPQTQKPRGRNLPTSGFGTHGDDLKDADKKAARGSWKTKEILEEIEEWEEWV